MNRTDDISNLFSRFGASADNYLEFESEFNYKEPSVTPVKPLIEAELEPLAEAVADVVAQETVEPVIAVAPVKLSVPSISAAIVPLTPQPVAFNPEPAVATPATDALPTRAATVPAPLRNLLAEVALARQAEAQARNDEALRQALPQGRPAKCKARVIALVSAKGGVGKTTLSAALASSLRIVGGQTLAIDLDPQNALQHHLGVEPDVAGMGSAGLTGKNWSDLLLPGTADSQLLPYGALSEEERRTLEQYMSNDRHWLARQLGRMTLSDNDVVILDTPPGRTVYLEQALDVADQVLVVTSADAASFMTLDQMDALLSAPDARAPFSVCSYVVNQFDASREFSRDMLEVLKRRLGAQLLSVIPLDHALGEALAYGHNPLATPGSSPACQDLLLLGEQLKARFESTRAAEFFAS